MFPLEVVPDMGLAFPLEYGFKRLCIHFSREFLGGFRLAASLLRSP